MKILIYKDVGAQSSHILLSWFAKLLPQYDVQYVSAAEIASGNALDNSKVAALAIGGGRSTPFKEKLAGAGDDAIEQFVNNGGAYYGFCAGAYYVCRTIDFTGKNFQKLKHNDKAVFYKGTAKGSLKGLAGDLYTRRGIDSVAIVDLQYGFNSHAKAYYHGGSIFYGDNNSEVIAKYADLPEQFNAAIVRCRVGQGYAVLSGVHPEISPSDILTMQNHGQNKQQLEKLARNLLGATVNNAYFHKHLLKGL